VLKRLALHPDMTAIAVQKWRRLWIDADPTATEIAECAVAPPRDPGHLDPTPKGTDYKKPTDPVSALDLAGQQKAAALRAQRIGFCEVADGTKIAYATLGSGPPLVKAANWLNHLEFDWDSPLWGRSFAEIARSRTFIRYDERGCGLSDWDVEDLSFGAFVEDLEAVVDKLGLERFPLIGISQGAAVSIEYAARHPERVSGLILISGYAAGWRHLASPEEQARREAVLTLTELGWGTDNPAYRRIFSQTFMPEAKKEELDWFDAFQRQTTSPRNAARFQDAFGFIDVRARLAQIKAPTIVLHSRHDQRIPIDLGRAMASGIPDARFVPLESRNHILVEYEPAWATCVEAINQFLIEKGI
jgi:pimeloyl-ACP methyl ester carboxylesterase